WESWGGGVPGGEGMGVLWNPAYQDVQLRVEEIQAAGRAFSKQIQVLQASTESAIGTAFAELAERRAGALLVSSDPFFFSRRHETVPLAAPYAVPAIFP